MKVKFRNRTWNVRYVNRAIETYGEVSDLGQIIFINSRYCPQELLDTEIHDALHACLPDTEETAIHDTANSISKFLWRRGYRRKKI